MLTKTIDGQVVRKGLKSGAGNDCTYLTPPGSAQPFAYDSKSERKLTFGTKARRRLVAAVAAGGLTLSVFGILSILGDPGMTHDSTTASSCIEAPVLCMTHDSTTSSIL